METTTPTEIMEMSHLSKEEILAQITKLFNQSAILKFTLLLQQTPLSQDDKNYEYTYKIDQISNKFSTRKPSPSIIDKYYKHSVSIRKTTNHNEESRFYAESKQNMDLDEFTETPKALGIRFYESGLIVEAMQIFQELSLDFPRADSTEEDQKQHRQILNYLGNCYFRSEKIEKAIEIYKTILKSQQNLQNADTKEVGQLFNNLGCCYGKLGFQKLSMNSYSSALKIYSKFNQVDSSPLLNNIATIYFNSQMFQISQKYYMEAIVERQNKKPNEKELLYYAHYKLGLAQMKQFKYKDALQNLDKALKLTTNKFGDASEMLKQCAYIKEVEGKWHEALEFYQKMYQIYQNQKKNKGFIFQKVAKIYSNIGREAEHKKYINLSIEQYKKQGNQRKMSELSNNRVVLSNLINLIPN